MKPLQWFVLKTVTTDLDTGLLSSVIKLTEYCKVHSDDTFNNFT